MKKKKKTDLDGQSMTVFFFFEKIAESDLENMIDYLNETNVNSFQKQRLFKAGLFTDGYSHILSETHDFISVFRTCGCFLFL
ncbi:hypothetical protein ACEQPO_08425 [Bacillus sp. SL00103]